MRALASYQCGPGSNPGVDAIFGLSLLLVISQCPERFFSGYSGFPLSSKTNFPNSNSTRNQTKNHYVDVLPANSYLFIYLFYSFHLSGCSYKDLCVVPGLTNPSFHVYFGGFSFVEMGRENGEYSC